MKKGTIATLSTLIGAAAGAYAGSAFTGKGLDQKQKKVDKFKNYYTMLNQWLILKQSGKNLSEYFQSNHYQTIAIYGMGEMGNRLFDELQNSDIKVACGIDRESECVYAEIDIYSPDQTLPEVDVIVVTSTFAFDEIQTALSSKVSCPVVSLEDIVYEI